MKFINLHQHTTYSFLDGFGQPQQYIDRLNSINQDGMAITDHGNIYAHVPFIEPFHKAGKKLVYGVELYCVEELIKERFYYHLTVLAKNNTGYKNLLKLVNLSNEESHFYYKPRVTFNEVLESREGLIILSGCCCDGFLVKEQNIVKIKRWLGRFKGDDFYIELQPFKDEKEKWNKLIQYVNQLEIPCIVTIDAHYPFESNKKTHDFQLAINTRKPFADPDRLKMDFPLHLPAIDEIIDRCKEMGFYKAEWLSSTYSIAMSCNVELPKTEMIKLNITTEQLREQCVIGMMNCGLSNNQQYINRLDYELNLIDQKGFNDYFWIIYDVVSWAKQRMLIGAGRGSSAGSLVCYLLGITEIDPLKHSLLFERFLSIERNDTPDVDLDFPASRRDLIINYVKEKYGLDKVAQIITFSSFAPRGIIQDASRILNIEPYKVNEITKQIAFKGIDEPDDSLKNIIKNNTKVNEYFQKHPILHDAVELEGQVKQIGRHAAGLVLSNRNLKEIGVINRDGVFSIDKYQIEKFGCLKIDVLGVETLDVIQDICKEVDFDFNKLYMVDLEDKKVYDSVFKPCKVHGIFQFEGYSLKNLCRSLKPSRFEHLIHATALGRPGSLHSGQTAQYIERFNGKPYKIPVFLKAYTANTLGILIFQEQIILICREIGQMSWEDVGKIRKAISKSYGEEYMATFRDKFVEGAEKQGIKKEEAKELFRSITSFGAYSFNRAHACSYAILSWWTAYLKTYFPAQFYARILKNEIDESKIKSVLKEWGGKIKIFDMNKSNMYFMVQKDGDQDVLVGGLTNIKGIGDKAAQKIIESRPYRSMEDFEKRNSKGSVKGVKKGLVNIDMISLQEQAGEQIAKISLTRPLWDCEKIINEGKLNQEFIVVCKVIEIMQKDHNEKGKVIQRGYKMLAPTEYMILKITDDSYNNYIVCFDRFYTAQKKKELLEGKDKICLLRVVKKGDGLLVGKRMKVLK